MKSETYRNLSLDSNAGLRAIRCITEELNFCRIAAYFPVCAVLSAPATACACS